jgi:hypothetical protein
MKLLIIIRFVYLMYKVLEDGKVTDQEFEQIIDKLGKIVEPQS